MTEYTDAVDDDWLDEEWQWETAWDAMDLEDEDVLLHHEAQRDKKTAPPEMVVDGADVKRVQNALGRRRGKRS